MTSRNAIVAAIAITIFGSLYLFYTPSPRNVMSGPTPTSSGGVPALEFKLSQISKSPPSLLVTLKNRSPSSTFTILKWGTPLDPQATNLGVFKFIDAETGHEVNTDVIKIRRKMPPAREDLQEVAPDTEHAIEVVFDKPWMPEKKPAKYKVKVEGEFPGVWETPVNQIKESELENYTSSVFKNKHFSSEDVLLMVE